jgi:uncharacterized protein with NRDE domain
MCLIIMAISQLGLMVAANRDERFDRPTRPAAFTGDVLAGQDLEKGGTWMGITRGGRFAALTNVRDPSARREAPRSRGWIVSEFLQSTGSPEAFSRSLPREELPAFNLLCGTTSELFFVRDDDPVPARVAPGIHGLSNARLDVPWPKVERGKRLMAEQPTTEALFEMLDDRATAPDELLPSTGVPLEIERALSAAHIVTPAYGTRCSTVLVARSNGDVSFEERTWDELGRETGRVLKRY